MRIREVNVAPCQGKSAQVRANAPRSAQQPLLVWLHAFSLVRNKARGVGRNGRRPSPFNSTGRFGPLHLRGRHADAVSLWQQLSLRNRLAIHSDEIIGRLAMGHAFTEELADRAGWRHLDRVGKPAAVVVDKEHLPTQCFLSGWCERGGKKQDSAAGTSRQNRRGSISDVDLLDAKRIDGVAARASDESESACRGIRGIERRSAAGTIEN